MLLTSPEWRPYVIFSHSLRLLEEDRLLLVLRELPDEVLELAEAKFVEDVWEVA
jgi:hypothetical protein